MAIECVRSSIDFLNKWPKSIAIGVGGVVCIFFYSKIKSIFRERKLEAAIQRRKAERNGFIDHLRRSLQTIDPKILGKRTSILALTFDQLVDKLQRGKITALDALEAYQWKAVEADDALNCVCVFFPDAAKWAEELDETYKDGDDKPPLFGVPVSIKESIKVQGFDSTRGYSTALFNPATEDSVVVAVLRRLGAIPFVHTNVPQGLFWFGCSNSIYGATKNPNDLTRTPGGSTGGEAALLAYGGSILGIGGDAGGSVRIPAHFCGIVSLKPSSTRVSTIGSLSSLPGRQMLNACVGPMGRDVDTVATTMSLLTLAECLYELDPYLTPSPWRDEIYFGQEMAPLRIGYYDHDGFLEAVPACRRAVGEAKDILLRNGHVLVPFSYPGIRELVKLALGAAMIDGGDYFYRMASQDIVDPLYAPAVQLFGTPSILRRFVGLLLRPFSPIASALLSSPPRSLADLRSIYARIQDARTRYVKEWKSLNLDAVVCPAFACVALPHSIPSRLGPAASYTIIHNVLDFVAGVVPVTRVNASDELEMRSRYQKGERFSKMVFEHCSEGTIGLPVAVQVVALPNEEERCLRVMKEIEEGRVGF